jgi:NAD dependent epimerase/dehydratase family enzyme
VGFPSRPGIIPEFAPGGFAGFLLASHCAIAARLTDAGFLFRYTALDEASAI